MCLSMKRLCSSGYVKARLTLSRLPTREGAELSGDPAHSEEDKSQRACVHWWEREKSV